MPSVFNILVCVLACVVGILIGRVWRLHKAEKTQKERRKHRYDPDARYKADGTINLAHYKNLNAVHEKVQQHEKQKMQKKAREAGKAADLSGKAHTAKKTDSSNKKQ